MRGQPCRALLTLLTAAALAAACDEDGGSLDAAADPDGAADPQVDGDVTPEPAGDPAADPEPETTVDAAPDAAPDPVMDPPTDPDTDTANAGCVARDTPGCGGCACESCVCEIEPHCCSLAWDDACVWDCEFICGAEC